MAVSLANKEFGNDENAALRRQRGERKGTKCEQARARNAEWVDNRCSLNDLAPGFCGVGEASRTVKFQTHKFTDAGQPVTAALPEQRVARINEGDQLGQIVDGARQW